MTEKLISSYVKPTSGVERILVFGQISLTPDDDSDPDREWYGAWWCGDTQAFHADGEGFIVSVTHWLPMPEAPAISSEEKDNAARI